MLWRYGRIVIPDVPAIKHTLLTEFHSSKLGVHSVQLRTYARMALQFFWPGMRSDVKKFIKACSICQRAKSLTTHPAGLLQPLPIPQQIWQDISMDFIVGLPVSKGNSVIFVVINRLSKYGHFMALRSNFNSHIVVEAFITHVVKLHGVPRSITSDRVRTFMQILATFV